jgi:hypothetical protein
LFYAIDRSNKIRDFVGREIVLLPGSCRRSRHIDLMCTLILSKIKN